MPNQKLYITTVVSLGSVYDKICGNSSKLLLLKLYSAIQSVTKFSGPMQYGLQYNNAEKEISCRKESEDDLCSVLISSSC